MTQDNPIDSNLSTLLERYRTGNISSSDLAELESLCARAATLSNAAQRAARIRSRRRWGLGTTLVAVVAVAIVFALPKGSADAVPTSLPSVPQIASTSPSMVPVAATPKAKPAARSQHSLPQGGGLQSATPTAVPSVADTVEPEVDFIEHVAIEPTVVCNTQCDADSVINEIWKFLKA